MRNAPWESYPFIINYRARQISCSCQFEHFEEVFSLRAVDYFKYAYMLLSATFSLQQTSLQQLKFFRWLLIIQLSNYTLLVAFLFFFYKGSHRAINALRHNTMADIRYWNIDVWGHTWAPDCSMYLLLVPQVLNFFFPERQRCVTNPTLSHLMKCLYSNFSTVGSFRSYNFMNVSFL